MKFALLGADEQSLALVQFLAVRPDHQLTAVYEPGDFESRLAALAPQSPVRSSWESLLHEPVADAVIVAVGPSERRAEQLVKLAKAGVPMLVVWPACDVVTAYELEMIRRDTKAPLAPLIPGRLHPAVTQLAALARQGETSPIGPVEQAVIERAFLERDRESVVRQFTRDVSLLRAVAGEVKKVGALGPAADAPLWSNLNVHMSGEGQTLMRWTLQPPQEEGGGKLMLFGFQGKAVLDMPADGQPWKLAATGREPFSIEFPDWNEPQAAIETFVRLYQGAEASPTWQDACREVEIASAVERSLARGKTIELYDEEVSEEATFKGMMAVGGCGILFLGLAAVLIAALVEGLHLPFRHHLLWRLWPVYFLVAILAFLALQFLRLVFRNQPGEGAHASSHDSAARQP